MKKITAKLGPSHSEFEHQLKDILNDMANVLEDNCIIKKSNYCDSCDNKCNIIIINISQDTYKYYCDRCIQ